MLMFFMFMFMFMMHLPKTMTHECKKRQMNRHTDSKCHAIVNSMQCILNFMHSISDKDIVARTLLAKTPISISLFIGAPIVFGGDIDFHKLCNIVCILHQRLFHEVFHQLTKQTFHIIIQKWRHWFSGLVLLQNWFTN